MPPKKAPSSRREMLEALAAVDTPIESSKPAYLELFEKVTDKLRISELYELLVQYSEDHNIREHSLELLDKDSRERCHNEQDLVLKVCLSLDSLRSVTRYLFAQSAVRGKAFSRRKVIRIPFRAYRVIDKLTDSVLMVTLLQKFALELQRADLRNTRVFYRANVYYQRLPGMSVFSIDRYDSHAANPEPGTAVIYVFDKLSYFFAVFDGISPSDVTGALEAALNCAFKPVKCPPDMTLRKCVMQQAYDRRLSYDSFSPHLRKLLRFQANTLREVPREEHLQKYPSAHNCQFKSISLRYEDGFTTAIQARHGENLLEALYEMEKAGRIELPPNVIARLSSNETNSFLPYELNQTQGG